MTPSLRITTFGWIVAVGLLVAVIAAASLAVVSVRHAETMSASWTKFEEVAAKKALLLSEIRGLLGYGGLIHHFKNFVLRQSRERVVLVHRNLLQLSVALTAYQALGLDERERAAFTSLVDTVERYRDMIAIAEMMADDGYSADEIDLAVRVDDEPAFRAIAMLNQRLVLLYRANTERVRQSVDHIASFSRRSGVVLVVVLMALAGLTVWFSYWRMIRPLRRIVDGFERVDPRDPGTERLPLADGVRGSELGSLVEAGNAFLDAVHDHSLSRKRAETEARDRMAHLRAVVENAVDAIITIDHRGTILTYNAAAGAIFQYAADDVIGNNISMLMPEPHSSGHDGYLRRYLETGEASIIGAGREVEGRRKNGLVFPMRLAVSETRTSEGTGFTSIIRDLTVEKENELRLRIAKHEAEKANRAKSEFLASMSHELRTPMNAILGFTELLRTNRDEPPSGKQRRQLDIVAKNGAQLLELINQVLDLSKIEAGELDVRVTEVDVAGLAEDCLESLSVLARDKAITVRNECRDAALPAVRTDPDLLRQVLLNLMSNAVKYNRPGGDVTVAGRVTEAGDLRLHVRDTGPGIPADKQDELFTPFNRLGREAGEIEGTGIGLTITRRLAEALGGTIGLNSEEGRGSDFWIDLPISGPGADAMPAARK